jgi:hypothetical protein
LVVDVPDLGDANHETWAVLIELGRSAPAPWTLIGAHMVGAHAWRRGRDVLRTTRDADVIVNARAMTDATSALSEKLVSLDFELEMPSRTGQGFRFKRGRIAIGVLAPDGLGPKAKLDTVQGAQTLQVPGGTQALARSGSVAVRSRDLEGSVPVPNLLGALLVTVRAIAVDDAPNDKKRDVALLLTLVDDPSELENDLSKNERSWLRKYREFGDPRSDAWEALVDPELGASVFLRLADLPAP